MDKTTKQTPVVVTHCEHCGLDEVGFVEATGECPRCGRTFRIPRIIERPHQDTIAEATANAAKWT